MRDILVRARILQPNLGAGARVHDDERGAVACTRPDHVGIDDAADVVHDRRSGPEDGVDNRGLVGVDANDHVGVVGVHPGHDRDDPLDLLFGRHFGLVRDSRLAADIHDVGARGDELLAQFQPVLQGSVASGVGEGLEYVGFISAAAVALSALGSGRLSVDRLVGLDRVGRPAMRAGRHRGPGAPSVPRPNCGSSGAHSRIDRTPNRGGGQPVGAENAVMRVDLAVRWRRSGRLIGR